MTKKTQKQPSEKYLQSKYGGGYVAKSLKTGRVRAHGKTGTEFLKQIRQRKIDLTTVILAHVPRKDVIYCY